MTSSGNSLLFGTRAPYLFLILSLVFTGCSKRDARAPQRPLILGIAGVTLISTNFAKSQSFYGDSLGLSPQKTEFEGNDQADPHCDRQADRCFLTSAGQGISILPPCLVEGPCETDFLFAITLETSDAATLRDFLKSKNIPVSEFFMYRGNWKGFRAIDPEHHRIDFIEAPSSKSAQNAMSALGIRIIHAGFIVHDRASTDHFYKDLLGFHLYWHGGMKDDKDDWIAMQVPDGTDWVEYMLNISPTADKHTLGVMNHIALGVPDIQAARAQLIKNGWKPGEEPKLGRDGKWQLNLYDPDDTRVEFMEFTPVQKPCCSEYTGPHPKP